MGCNFDDDGLLDSLESSTIESFDELDFGLITMDRSGRVIGYNACEARRAALEPSKVLDRDFFTTVAPCTNNFMIAQRYLDEPDLDDVLDYVFTLRMKPTPVRLRLLANAGSERQYLAVQDR